MALTKAESSILIFHDTGIRQGSDLNEIVTRGDLMLPLGVQRVTETLSRISHKSGVIFLKHRKEKEKKIPSHSL